MSKYPRSENKLFEYTVSIIYIPYKPCMYAILQYSIFNTQYSILNTQYNKQRSGIFRPDTKYKCSIDLDLLVNS